MTDVAADVPKGVPRERVNEHMRDISIAWAGKTPEYKECQEIQDRMKELESKRENRHIGRHGGHVNAALAAFHDSRLTMEGIKDSVREHSKLVIFLLG